jgi:hypothetical protein
VAQHTTGRRSAIDRRTTRHAGYHLSQRARHRIEEVFAWVKIIAGRRKTRPSRPRSGVLAFHPGHGRLQPDPSALAPGRPVVIRRRMAGAGSRRVNNPPHPQQRRSRHRLGRIRPAKSPNSSAAC